MRHFSFLLLFFIIRFAFAQQRAEDILDKNTDKQIDKLTIQPTTPENYLKLTNATVKAIADTANHERSIKAQILLDKLANHLKEEITNGVLDTHDEQVKAIDKVYQEFKFHIIPPHRPSELEKLIHYVYEGRLAYIYNRMSNSDFFLPLVAGLLVVLIFSAINLLGLIKWKFRIHYNWFLVSSISVGLVAFAILMIKYKP